MEHVHGSSWWFNNKGWALVFWLAGLTDYLLSKYLFKVEEPITQSWLIPFLLVGLVLLLI